MGVFICAGLRRRRKLGRTYSRNSGCTKQRDCRSPATHGRRPAGPAVFPWLHILRRRYAPELGEVILNPQPVRQTAATRPAAIRNGWLAPGGMESSPRFAPSCSHKRYRSRPARPAAYPSAEDATTFIGTALHRDSNHAHLDLRLIPMLLDVRRGARREMTVRLC